MLARINVSPGKLTLARASMPGAQRQPPGGRTVVLSQAAGRLGLHLGASGPRRPGPARDRQGPYVPRVRRPGASRPAAPAGGRPT
eukprot:1376990-Lingulodinium_polyedra.AAC.1